MATKKKAPKKSTKHTPHKPKPTKAPEVYNFTCPCCFTWFTNSVPEPMPCPICVDKILQPYTHPKPEIIDFRLRERVMVELPIKDGVFLADIGKIAGAHQGQYVTLIYAVTPNAVQDIVLDMNRLEFHNRIRQALDKAEGTF